MGTRAYLTAEGLLAPTQEAAGKGATKVDIPYEKGAQLDFINGLLRQAGGAPAGEPEDAPRPGGPLSQDDLVDGIATSKGNVFGHVLEATFERLGELGEEGWSYFRAILRSPCYQSADRFRHGGGIHKVERGMRFCALSQLRDLEGEGS